MVALVVMVLLVIGIYIVFSLWYDLWKPSVTPTKNEDDPEWEQYRHQV